MIQFACPTCGKSFSVSESNAGKTGVCSCGQQIIIPKAIRAIKKNHRHHVEPQSQSGLGVAALVLGILAISGSWIPFLGLLSIPVAAIGLLLGIIGTFISLVGRKSKSGFALAGSFICLLAIVLAIGMTSGAATVLDETSTAFDRQPGTFGIAEYYRIREGMSYTQVCQISAARARNCHAALWRVYRASWRAFEPSCIHGKMESPAT